MECRAPILPPVPPPPPIPPPSHPPVHRPTSHGRRPSSSSVHSVGEYSPAGPYGGGSKYASRHSPRAGLNHLSHGEITPNTPPTPAVSGPPPGLPRNLVLLSIMEAAETSRTNFGNSSTPDSFTQCPDATRPLSVENFAEDFDAEEARYMAGISEASSTCGTYAVADHQGLVVLRQRPRDNNNGNSEGSTTGSTGADDPMRALMIAQASHIGPSSISGSECSVTREQRDGQDDTVEDVWKEEGSDDGEGSRSLPYVLRYGERVQVVDAQDGWVKLSRGRGYLYASGSQLVKVGGPIDRACRIEASLISIANRMLHLKEEQDEIDRITLGLLKGLEEALEEDEPTVYEPLTPEMEPELGESEEEDRKPEFDVGTLNKHTPPPPSPPLNQQVVSVPAPTTPVNNVSVGIDQRSLSEGPPRRLVAFASDPTYSPPQINLSLSLPSNPGDDSDEGDGYDQEQEEKTLPTSSRLETRFVAVASGNVNSNGNTINDGQGYGCSPTHVLRGLYRIDDEEPLYGEGLSHSPNPLNMVEARQQQLLPPSRVGSNASSGNSIASHHGSPGNVDFRTGMSGHLALLSSNANYRGSTTPIPRGSSARLMSGHTGLSQLRRSMREVAQKTGLSTKTW